MKNVLKLGLYSLIALPGLAATAEYRPEMAILAITQEQGLETPSAEQTKTPPIKSATAKPNEQQAQNERWNFSNCQRLMGGYPILNPGVEVQPPTAVPFDYPFYLDVTQTVKKSKDAREISVRFFSVPDTKYTIGLSRETPEATQGGINIWSQDTVRHTEGDPNYNVNANLIYEEQMKATSMNKTIIILQLMDGYVVASKYSSDGQYVEQVLVADEDNQNRFKSSTVATCGAGFGDKVSGEIKPWHLESIVP